MPLFPLANAGVVLGISTAAATSPVSLGIVLGLVASQNVLFAIVGIFHLIE